MSAFAKQELTAPACTQFTDVFQHRLLEDGVPAKLEERREQGVLIARAEEMCLECPLMTSCLYAAVVQHDVAGFVAGTTSRQRAEMRQALGIRVQPEDFDTLAGVTTPNRQVDHDEVVRLRNANPYDSLDSIAQRLGCSLSTVKRHLRKARATATLPATPLHRIAPSLEQVLAAYRDVVTRRAQRNGARPARAA